MSGPLIAGIAAVIVAAITVGVPAIVASRRPAEMSTAATVAQLGQQVATLSAQVSTLIDERDAERTRVNVLGDGFDAVIGVLERITPAPLITAEEREAIARAKAARADDRDWNAGARPPKIRQ